MEDTFNPFALEQAHDQPDIRGRQVTKPAKTPIRRSSSPGQYVHDRQARSQSPSGSVYSDFGRVELPWDVSPDQQSFQSVQSFRDSNGTSFDLRRSDSSGSSVAATLDKLTVASQPSDISAHECQSKSDTGTIHPTASENIEAKPQHLLMTRKMTVETWSESVRAPYACVYCSKKIPLACIPCRRKRIYCSGKHPSCKNCLNSKTPCFYPPLRSETSFDKYQILPRHPENSEVASSNTREELPPASENANTRSSLPGSGERSGPSAQSSLSPCLPHSTKMSRTSPRDLDVFGTVPQLGTDLIVAGNLALGYTSDIPRLYRYSPIASSELRLLRISPGEPGDPLVCALKTISVEKIKNTVLFYQALSYAWGNSPAECEISLYDLPKSNGTGEDLESFEKMEETCILKIRKTLHQALTRIRMSNEDIWLWVDAICIDQADDADKSNQIPKMPDIYSNAWNVIVWLGEDEMNRERVDLAVSLIPHLLNLESLERMLRNDRVSQETPEAWEAFGYVLRRSWFCRRWVIQEIASARKLSVRVKDHILSWVDFTDALNIYLHSMERVKRLARASPQWRVILPSNRSECTRASILVEVSRKIFRKSADSTIQGRLHNLETLVLMTAAFEVSEIRDTVYALLFLAHDSSAMHSANTEQRRSHLTINTDYSRHPVDLFSDFVRYSLEQSQSLDIICRPWAAWPSEKKSHRYKGKKLPSWIGVASFAQDSPLQRIQQSEILLGKPGRPIYNASRGIPMRAAISPHDNTKLLVRGVYIGRIGEPSSIMSSNKIGADVLQLLGCSGQPHDGYQDILWKTLIADRDLHGKQAPTWYWRACALALSKVDLIGDFIPHKTSTEDQHFDLIEEYLKRVRAVVHRRRAFLSIAHAPEDARDDEQTPIDVGLGPEDIKVLDSVYILFGCSVPVVLRTGKGGESFKVIGPCYMHGYMEGERFTGLSAAEVDEMAVDLELE